MALMVEYPHIVKISGQSARLERLPRIRVAQIVMGYLAHGWSAEQICEHYPYLSLAEIHAAMGYYFDHQSEIDGEMEEELRELQRVEPSAEMTPLHLKLRVLLRDRKPIAANIGNGG